MSAVQATPTRAVAVLRWISMLATAALAAKGEFDLATAIGLPTVAAVLYPLGLDAYMWAAIIRNRRRDVTWALGLAIASQELAHLVHADWHRPGMVALTVAVSAIPPLVCQRVHLLADHTAAAPTDEPAVDDELPVEPPIASEPAAQTAPAVPVNKSKRTREQTRTLIERLRADEPGIADTVIAARLGITDRWVRAVAPRPLCPIET